MINAEERLRISRAIIVEGRDDVDAVSRACDALIIPTHGYGISRETWDVIAKAYDEKGIIILTDPDAAGERIRRRLTERFPEAVQCSIARRDAVDSGDIGVENAAPEVIADALAKAIALSERRSAEDESSSEPAGMDDLMRLGLTGTDGASELRAEVCRRLGIGCGNAKATVRRLRGFGIGRDELEETVNRIKEETI